MGGTHVESDASGASAEYILYTPFGDTLVDVSSGSYNNDHKYTDKEQDEDSGFYYYGARYYNPKAGVFVAQDPVYLALGTGDLGILRDPQSLNSYSYGRNNPIANNDPTGEFWNFVLGAIATTWNVAVDPVLTTFSVVQAMQEPTATNIGAAALDVGMLASPLPAGAGIAVNLAQTGSVAKTAENMAEAGVTFEQKLTNALDYLASQGDNVLKPTQDYINPTKVEEYYNNLSSGGLVSPIEVFRNGESQMILDGHHRYIGGQMAGIEVPRVEMGEGSLYGTDWGKIELTQ